MGPAWEEVFVWMHVASKFQEHDIRACIKSSRLVREAQILCMRGARTEGLKRMGKCRQMMEVGEPNSPRCTKMVQDGPYNRSFNASDLTFT